jgi:glyoxalase/bleomycin resistance protein/dioxygenase superfamily protein
MMVAMDKQARENRGGDEARPAIGRVHLHVADLDRAMTFYRVLGFDTAHPVGTDGVHLSAGVSDRFAIRLPHRGALAQTFRRLTAAGVAIERAEDEGVSEALFVRDPDGHAIEVYYDRPREEWPRAADGTLNITPAPLDLDALGATAETEQRPVIHAPTAADMSETSRNRLRDLRVRLLTLHKALLEDAKTAYEMDRGRIGSSANLLQLVINDPWFAWLHPLSEVVVRIDETIEPDSPATEADGAALVEQVERLLAPAENGEAFARRYFEALQRQPSVVLAHADVRRVLKSMR